MTILELKFLNSNFQEVKSWRNVDEIHLSAEISIAHFLHSLLLTNLTGTGDAHSVHLYTHGGTRIVCTWAWER